MKKPDIPEEVKNRWSVSYNIRPMKDGRKGLFAIKFYAWENNHRHVIVQFRTTHKIRFSKTHEVQLRNGRSYSIYNKIWGIIVTGCPGDTLSVSFKRHPEEEYSRQETMRVPFEVPKEAEGQVALYKLKR